MYGYLTSNVHPRTRVRPTHHMLAGVERRLLYIFRSWTRTYRQRLRASEGSPWDSSICSVASSLRAKTVDGRGDYSKERVRNLFSNSVRTWNYLGVLRKGRRIYVYADTCKEEQDRVGEQLATGDGWGRMGMGRLGLDQQKKGKRKETAETRVFTGKIIE